MSGAPTFVDYDSAQAWIDERVKAYGGRNRFFSSDEYKAALPAITQLYQQEKETSAKKIHAKMREHGVAVGDEVVYAVTSGFGMGTLFQGKVFDKKGWPYVRLDKESAALAGKTTVAWGPQWQRARAENSGDLAGLKRRLLAR